MLLALLILMAKRIPEQITRVDNNSDSKGKLEKKKQ
jgi:hypothetical protein